MIKISIIVPVYNVEQYLAKCLDSLINQTLKEIEIICINDGSTDNSLEILNEYAQNDSRIVVIDKENEGQGIARNLGISKAKGEYIGFVDPDDWVSLDMYEKMYNQAKKLNSEIVICDYVKYEQWCENVYRPKLFARAINSIKEEFIHIEAGQNIDKAILNQTLLISPCYSVNRIYRTELLRKNDIKFDTIRCYEDCIFILQSHIEANNISYINIPFYNYRLHQNSTLRNYEQRYKDGLQTYEKIIQYLNEKEIYEDFKINLDYFIAMNAYWIYMSLSNCRYKKILKKEVKKYLCEYNYKLFLRKCKNANKKILSKIFSVTNKGKYKIINIFGHQINLPRYKFQEPIDIVYCWVDGNDVEWQKEKLYWQQKLGIPVTDAMNSCRFIDNQELKYSLRSVAKNLPWINHIYIVTNGQVPKWLDTTHPKITIINHKDIMPSEALPTFNSEAIETCIVNIPNLSEHFLYANDDYFTAKHISKKYFFDKKGRPIIRLEKRPKKKELLETKLYLINLVYSANLISEKLGKNYKYQASHNIDSYTKSSFIECKKLFENEFYKTSCEKFRTPNSIQRTSVFFYMLAKNLCKLRVLKTHSRKSKLENIYVDLQSPEIMDKEIKRHGSKLKLFCINDNEKAIDEDRKRLKSYLELLFPHRIEWEKD